MSWKTNYQSDFIIFDSHYQKFMYDINYDYSSILYDDIIPEEINDVIPLKNDNE